LFRLRHGDRAGGAAILAFAEQRSRRDWQVEDALMNQAIGQGQWDAAVARADALLRTDREGVLRPSVFRLLDAMAAEPAPRAALVRRLGVAPPAWWREAYLRQLGATIDPAVAVFIGLRASPAPPRESEYRPVIETLVADGRYGEAIALWRALSTRADAAALLRDGAFAGPADGTPFTWRRAAGVGGSGEIDRTAGGPGLHVAYDGVGDLTLTSQLLVLGPGRYRLAWRERGIGPGRLAWRIRCADEPRILGEAAATPSAAWTDRALTLEVPASGCPAQWVELVATPGERRADIEAWYAGLALTAAHAGTAALPVPPS
jgi:hypothetical protein